MDIIFFLLMAVPFMAYGFLACVVEARKRKAKEMIDQESSSEI